MTRAGPDLYGLVTVLSVHSVPAKPFVHDTPEAGMTIMEGRERRIAWMRSFGQLQRVGIGSTGGYGAGLLRSMQQAGVVVLEVTTADKQDRRRRGKNDDLDAQNAAHAAFAGQQIVTPRSRDGMIECLRVLMACRKTAVAARRALQMIHNTIVRAPDEPPDQLRALTRMQLVRTLASWRPDLTAYRDLDSAYRIGLKSLGRRYLELHVRSSISMRWLQPLSTSWRRTSSTEIPSATPEQPNPYGRRQSRKIEVGGQLRIPVRPQSGPDLIRKDHPPSALRTRTTIRCARVSSPTSSANSSIVAASDLTARREWRSFSSSKASTIPHAATRPWATFRPSNRKEHPGLSKPA
jgi:hypothetical protein